MIQIKECLINKVNRLKYGTLSLNIHIKQEDYTDKIRKQLEDLEDNGNSLVMILEEFGTKPIEDQKPKLRQQLAILMNRYSDIRGQNADIETKILYKKYNIKSRKSLGELQLKQAIDYYTNNLYY